MVSIDGMSGVLFGQDHRVQINHVGTGYGLFCRSVGACLLLREPKVVEKGVRGIEIQGTADVGAQSLCFDAEAGAFKFVHRQPAQSGEEVQMPGTAAEFSVRDRFQADSLFLGDEGGYLLVLHFRQGLFGQFALQVARAGFFQARRPQKTAHDVVAERSHVSEIAHGE